MIDPVPWFSANSLLCTLIYYTLYLFCLYSTIITSRCDPKLTTLLPRVKDMVYRYFWLNENEKKRMEPIFQGTFFVQFFMYCKAKKILEWSEIFWNFSIFAKS